MIEEFVAPRYGSGALCDLLPSIEAALAGQPGVIELPKASTYVVLMVDGLGTELLREHADDAPRLAEIPRQTLTCSVPSTTACSLTSLGCGVWPGQHGVVGYTFREPTVGGVVNALTWEGGPADVAGFRQVPTRFEAIGRRGRSCGSVTLGRFAGSALTDIAFGGTNLLARPLDEQDVPGTVARVAEAVAEHDVVYVYHRLLDHSGHSFGIDSDEWLAQLAVVEELVVQAGKLAGRDVCLLATGDHGMVNIPQAHRVVAEAEPELAGWTHLAGEGRFRQLYTEDPADLGRRWAAFLGERAVVVRREEAIEAGWFGPEVTDKTAARIGDVLVAMRDDWAVMSTAFEGEFSLVGMHGSLTAAEMLVPLLTIGGTAR